MPHKLRNVRVLVVNPNGLVAILYPAAPDVNADDGTTRRNYHDKNDETTTTTTTTATSTSTSSSPQSKEGAPTLSFEKLDLSSRMLQVDDSSSSRNNDNDENEKINIKKPAHEEEEHVVEEIHEEDLWDLKKVSLIHQKSLVIAELAWNPVKVSEDQEYLITWELDGGGLKGHLVTDSTSVSLSLWPDTLYHIQVKIDHIL
jgi:hypothetical protein